MILSLRFIALLFSLLVAVVYGSPLKNQVAQAKSAFKSYTVSFADDVSTSVVEAAMQQVRDTEGTVTHVFNLIKGFLAIASEDSMATISTLSEGITVEEDQIVTTSG